MSEFPANVARLFVRYREVCGDPEVSAAFTPGLWARIEGRRGFGWHLKIYARRVATVAAALCLLLFGTQFPSMLSANPVYEMSYVDSLNEGSSAEQLTYVHYIPMSEVAP
jgi:hypothetical protein